MNGWAVNEPAKLKTVLGALETIQKAHANVSLADLIVLAGGVGIEQAAKAGGHDVTVPFTPGRADATQEETEIESFAWLEPKADGFRNYVRDPIMSVEEHLVDRAQLLDLSAPEMTVLVGGLRVLQVGDDKLGVFTDKPGVLTNDFFTNLLDMGVKWTSIGGTTQETFEAKDRKTGKVKWTATRADLIFGSHSQLRALAEVYGASDAKAKFVKDFVKAWVKVMELDRFDLKA